MARRTATSAVQVQNASASLSPSESGSFVTRRPADWRPHRCASPRARAPSVPPLRRAGDQFRRASDQAPRTGHRARTRLRLRSSRATSPMTTPSSSATRTCPSAICSVGSSIASGWASSWARTSVRASRTGAGALELQAFRHLGGANSRVRGRHRAAHATARRAALLRRSRTSCDAAASFPCARRREHQRVAGMLRPGV